MKLFTKTIYYTLLFLNKIPLLSSLLKKTIYFSYSVVSTNMNFLYEVKKISYPKLIIDIGVYRGTPDLYNTFEKSFFLLIDPIIDDLIFRPKKYSIINKAVFSKKQKREFYMFKDYGANSLFSNSKKAVMKTKQVETITLNSIFKDYSKQYDSIGLKIDAQGSEYDILSSIKSFPINLDWIIVENNISSRYNNFSNLSSVTRILDLKGFKLVNILQPSRPIIPEAYECLYIRENINYLKSI